MHLPHPSTTRPVAPRPQPRHRLRTRTRTRTLLRVLAPALAAVAMAAACGSGESTAADSAAVDTAPSETSPSETTAADTEQTQGAATGIRLISAAEGAELQNNPPDDLVILDVRTAEEFGDGHLADATMLDFYQPDFADRLAELDPDVPYLVYCRSGNRSGQTAALMEKLGFTDVADVDGGIIAWADAGLPMVTP